MTMYRKWWSGDGLITSPARSRPGSTRHGHDFRRCPLAPSHGQASACAGTPVSLAYRLWPQLAPGAVQAKTAHLDGCGGQVAIRTDLGDPFGRRFVTLNSVLGMLKALLIRQRQPAIWYATETKIPDVHPTSVFPMTPTGGFKGNKQSLPRKICAACGREMVWRKRWAQNWTEVKYCSDACRKAKND